jgi:hypothetical protein
LTTGDPAADIAGSCCEDFAGAGAAAAAGAGAGVGVAGPGVGGAAPSAFAAAVTAAGITYFPLPSSIKPQALRFHFGNSF